MTPASPAKGLIALLRLPYWLMTGGLSVLTAFAITKTMIAPQTILLIFFYGVHNLCWLCHKTIISTEKVDAVIKPKRPIPSGALSLKQVVAVSSILFALGLVMAALINWLSFAIIAVDSLLLLVYSYMVKRKSGFVANILVGILTGTAFMYGQATITNPAIVNLVSLSLYPIAFGTIGGNVLRDILSVEGTPKLDTQPCPRKSAT
jgi:4-hydroxybenzoate polyprenyltransferase